MILIEGKRWIITYNSKIGEIYQIRENLYGNNSLNNKSQQSPQLPIICSNPVTFTSHR